MKLTQFCIQRPVFTVVLTILLVVIGFLSLTRVDIRGYPKLSVPVVTVKTVYTGASAAVVESQITTPIENQLAGLSGLDSIHSYSQQGQSKVILRFSQQENIDTVADEVRNLVGGSFLHKLPTGVEAPIINKRDPNAQQTLLLTLSDAQLSPMALTDYSNRYLLPELQQLDGVADVQLENARAYAMRIELDPLQMATHKVTVGDISHALSTQNINMAGGEIKTPQRYYNVFTRGQMQSAHAFKQMIIAKRDNYMLRLQDVAQVHVAAETVDSSMRVNGQPSIGLSVYAESDANPLQVAGAVAKRVEKMNASLPAGMQLQVIYNASTFLSKALQSVGVDLLLAIALVVLVVYLFLVQWRAALIPIITIPICIISVFTYIYIVGYSINIFTLLAMVLAIGLVVDDAIVMLENIVRHMEAGLSPLQAAFKGSREIGFAIIAMTITLAAVYAPIGFARGLTGVVFREFAFTLAVTVIISGFVALTLSPMMAAYCLRPASATPVAGITLQLRQFFSLLEKHYSCILQRLLVRRVWVLAFLLLLCAGGLWCYSQLSSSLVPAEDMGHFMVTVAPPANASFQYIEHFNKLIEKKLQTYPAVEHVAMMSDATGGFAIVMLKPWRQRHISSFQLMQQLMRYARTHLPEVKVSAFSPGTIGGGGKGGDSIRMSIVSNQSYAAINQQVQAFLNKVLALPGVAQATEDLQLHNLQYDVALQQDLIASAGVNPQDVSQTIRTMLGGEKITTFNWQNRDYDVILQAQPQALHSLSVLDQMYVRNAQDTMFPVSSLAQISSQVLPTSLPHQDRLRADTIQVQLKPGYRMGAVVKQLMHLAHRQLPDGYSYRFRGVARDMLQAYGTQLLTFCMALLVIYLVLCAQFESFIDPLIILLSVPMALIGAVLMLYLTGHEMSIYASIGFVTLIGLIAKHGILITEFANNKRRQGTAITEAVVDAARLRLRPILMTTLAMVSGAVPLALATGANANGLQPIGWVIVGGMSIGTFFSLVVVPLAYSFFAKWRHFKAVARPD